MAEGGVGRGPSGILANQNCPQCNSTCAEIEGDCFLGTCGNCQFLFCSECQGEYHGFEDCRQEALPATSDVELDIMLQLLSGLMSRNRFPSEKKTPAANPEVDFPRDFSNETKSDEHVPPKASCIICLTDVAPEEIVDLGCSHKTACGSCMKGYFEAQINSGEVSGLTCPTEKCGWQAPQYIIRQLVDTQSYTMLENILLSIALADTPEAVHCPRAQCQRLLIAEPEYGYCENCDYTFCTGCNLAFHGVTPCGMSEQEQRQYMIRYAAADEAERVRLDEEIRAKRRQENERSEKYIKKEFKKCPAPTCSTYVEKNGGCNAMTCKTCGSNFCWLCGKLIFAKDPHSHFEGSSPCALFYVPPE